MKCVCGYEYVECITYKNGDSGYEVVKGDEPFKEIIVQCRVHRNFMFEPGEQCIYACPKCGTFKIEI